MISNNTNETATIDEIMIISFILSLFVGIVSREIKLINVIKIYFNNFFILLE